MPVADSEMAAPVRFYICPVCFQAADAPVKCHGHPMVPCHADSIEDCRPLMGNDGQLLGRAPRWFLRAIKRLRT